ncbi:AJAP1 protein, partial [Dryoscopus gambensis]|nr:AJAP1 protein [Dryoscopus gambensis]
SLSVHRSGCPLGSHAWILIAMFHLAMDLASCQPPATGAGGRLSPRPALRHRLSRGSLVTLGTGRAVPGLLEPRRSALPRARRHRSRSCPRLRFCFQRNRALGWFDFIFRVFPFIFSSSVPLGAAPRLPCRMRPGWLLPGWASLLTWHAWARAATAFLGPVGTCSHRHHPLGTRSMGAEVFLHASPSGVPIPTLFFLLSAGLAVHQIITITVSLIMVIAALITTLVLKNCCAQSGRPRRNSHQRKLDQQEESCQNLTDFAPARVPSALDIFTAYNETLQCSHECVRTPVPVYAEDTLHSPGDYKTTFNGNRPSSSDRHLIPVAFVSEKWFEISC